MSREIGFPLCENALPGSDLCPVWSTMFLPLKEENDADQLSRDHLSLRGLMMCFQTTFLSNGKVAEKVTHRETRLLLELPLASVLLVQP